MSNQKKSLSVGIIGGGVTGLAAAYYLQKAGAQVTIFEKSASVGGLIHSVKIGETALERHYHHIFRSDTTIIELIKAFHLTNKLHWQKASVAMLDEGNLYRFTSPIDILRYPPLPFPDRVRLAAMAAYLKFERDWHKFEGIPAKKWITKYMGPRVYEKIWAPLLEAKFGEHASDIAMQWFWARVHCRTFELGYLAGGFMQLFDMLATYLTDHGVIIKLNQDVSLVDTKATKPYIIANGKQVTFDKIIVTVATPLFIKLAKNLPQSYIDSISGTRYLGAQNVLLILKQQLTPFYWISIMQKGLPFLVVVEHTNFMPKSHYNNSHVVYFGRYIPMSSTTYQQSEAASINEAIAMAKRLQPAFNKSWIKETIVSNGPFAQPIITTNYHKILPEIKTPLKNIYLANMSQIYPYDRGQNYSIALGEKVAHEVLL